MTRRVEIRAVAVSLSTSRVNRSYLEEVGTKLEEYSRNLPSASGFEVRTRRLVLPFLEDLSRELGFSLERVAEEVCSVVEELGGVDYVALPLRSAKGASWIIGVLKRYEKAFFSVPYVEGEEPLVEELVRGISVKAGPVEAAHFAVSFGEQLHTPYFPATASKGDSTMLSLLYPSYLSSAIKEGKGMRAALEELASKVVGAAKEVLKESGLPSRLGVDYSLSPWMEESAAAVIEDLKGTPLNMPGTHYAILEINKAIWEVAERYDGLGYNEVMLPVAEDDRLKELVAKGDLALSQLVSYVSVCVAGLDMVLLPLSVEEGFIASLVRDLAAIREVKGRTLGMRVILVDAEPGEVVELGFFGKTPVADPYG